MAIVSFNGAAAAAMIHFFEKAEKVIYLLLSNFTVPSFCQRFSVFYQLILPTFGAEPKQILFSFEGTISKLFKSAQILKD